MEVIWRMIHVVDCSHQLVSQMVDRVAVSGFCRLVHFDDVLLLQIISHFPGTMRPSIVILGKLSPKCCLANGTKVSRMMFWYIVPGTQGVIKDLASLWNAFLPTPSPIRAETPGSLVVLLEAFSWQSTNSHAADHRVQPKTWGSSGSCEHGSLWPQVGCWSSYDQHVLHTNPSSPHWKHGHC